MKLAVGILVFLWLMCGAIGAFMDGELDSFHWKEIAKGPFTLAEAVNDHPASYPGP